MEAQYLKAVTHIMKNGDERPTRTGTNTLCEFGIRLDSDVSEEFPILTTKHVPFRIVAEELLWFLRGDTNVQHLRDKRVHIWDANTSRKTLDNLRLSHYKEFDAGPVYGFQWRHFGAVYRGCDENYKGEGVDQIENLIQSIKMDPYGRRKVVSAWNPVDLPKMALPPCHFSFQCHVSQDRLHLKMTQRSADMGLGVPFNMASYALLLHILAKKTHLKVGKLIMDLGDAHIYKNHIPELTEQLTRKPFAPPTLQVHESVATKPWNELNASDFILVNYKCHPRIPMPMAV